MPPPDGYKRLSQTKRAALLRSAGLEFASPAEREVFWKRYNLSQRRSARKPLKLADVAGEWLTRESVAARDVVVQVARLWHRVLPPDLVHRSRIEGFARKRLRIRVDSKSTEFVLRRSVESAFLAAVRRELTDVDIERVIYRVGRILPEV